MDEKNESDNNDEKPGQSEQAATLNVREVNPKGNPTNTNTDTNKRKREPMSGFECWMVALTILGIAVAGLTGGAIYWQAQIGAATLAEIKNSGTDTHDLALAAKTQAENTAKQLTFSERQANAAQDSVKAIQTQMRQDQGPYIG